MKLRLTVISDLHCKHTSSDLDANKKSLRSTILYSDLLRRDIPPKHPIHSFLQQVEKNMGAFKSDVLLCPGDITDKFDSQGYITGWSFLEEIKEAIQAPKLYATIGNHDVDSRRSDPKAKPFTVAQAIKYNYPICEKEAQADFWNEHFCVIENEEYIILIFNSSHSHLSYDDAKQSYIEKDVIDKMEEKIKRLSSNKIKIALCHHHPIGQANTSSADLDVIDKGGDFLEMLSKNDFSIVIHGHKHEVKIRYYNSLIVFCAGSFSSTDNIKETESDNVFHVIEFLSNKKGIIKTWYYGTHNGWHQKASKKFPPLTGFGFKGDIDKLAENISTWFNGKGTGNDIYTNLINQFEDVQFLIPDDQRKLTELLESKYNIELTYNDQGIPRNVSKIIK